MSNHSNFRTLSDRVFITFPSLPFLFSPLNASVNKKYVDLLLFIHLLFSPPLPLCPWASSLSHPLPSLTRSPFPFLSLSAYPLIFSFVSSPFAPHHIPLLSSYSFNSSSSFPYSSFSSSFSLCQRVVHTI